MTQKILNDEGQQGDVQFFRLSDKHAAMLKRKNRTDVSHDGRLILAYGELTGHHHSIGVDVLDRPKAKTAAPPPTMEEVKALIEKQYTPNAVMYEDKDLVNTLVSDGELLRSDLAIGFLEVNDPNGVNLEHHEHDTINIAKGIYYVGRQIESVGAEERRVAD